MFQVVFGQKEQDHEKLSGYVVNKLKFKKSSFRMNVTTVSAKSNLLYGSLSLDQRGRGVKLTRYHSSADE